MNGFALKTIAVTALVCFLADSIKADVVLDGSITTEEPSKSFKEKFSGFVNSVKEGASDAYDSVSDSVSGVAKKVNEKSKEAVNKTKNIVNGAIDKIKTTYNNYKNDNSSEEITGVQATVEEGKGIFQEVPGVQKPEKFTNKKK
ncbi:uncharacterized protein LOC126835732 isoform X1 [Adelges cooleyi]|uniref:uncharacterized protein LOC126835732 isoform X1 n=1 Tax=Adelges cooleyi TaxID=133065 RepID=UPI00217F9ED1|nr:uncharacterized protein LOC126835732 isoform X1 [Adelges cooleyi]